MIQDERRGNASMLVVDAGDSLTGDMEPAVRTKGASSVEAMNRMGYDAGVLGAADLSLGAGVVRQRMAEARFPFLSADMTIAATGEAIAAGYSIQEVAGRQVAIAGISAAPAINGFKAADAFETAEDLAAELGAKGLPIILLSRAAPQVNERIADEIPGIAVIIEGGARSRGLPWISEKTGTPIYHADQASRGHAGRAVGIAALRLEGGELAAQDWRVKSLGPDVKDDPAMSAWVQEVWR